MEQVRTFFNGCLKHTGFTIHFYAIFGPMYTIGFIFVPINEINWRSIGPYETSIRCQLIQPDPKTNQSLACLFSKKKNLPILLCEYLAVILEPTCLTIKASSLGECMLTRKPPLALQNSFALNHDSFCSPMPLLIK
jgi:hypothetical protein